MIDYMRGLSEEKFEQVLMACIDKVEKNSDKDWQDIVEEFDLQIHRDVLRKAISAPMGAYPVYKFLMKKAESNINESEIIQEIEEKRLELAKERKKIQAVKVEYNKLIRDDSRRELLYENIADTIERLPLPKFETIEYKPGSGEYLLSWADIHYGATFVSENNKYSREECKKRFEYLSSWVINKCRNQGVSKLTIVGLGDDIQGILRISDVKINDIPVVESVVEISRLIACFLNEVSKVVEVKYYHTMASNHSQTRPLTGKPDLIKEDLEFIIGNYIKDLTLNNHRIDVVLTDKDYHSFTLGGQNILALHGHQVKNLKSSIKDYSLLHRKFYDIILLGHLHGGQHFSASESENGNTEVVLVPSFVGSDPYADSLKVGSKAMAKLYKIEVGCGITENYSIILN